MAEGNRAQKVLVVGAGPVGALAALYAAKRGDDVHVYELRAGKGFVLFNLILPNYARPLLEESLILLYQRRKWSFKLNLSDHICLDCCTYH